jgi:hypothetical protein
LYSLTPHFLLSSLFSVFLLLALLLYSAILLFKQTSVVDHCSADPDPTFHPNADPDPDPSLKKAQTLEKVLKQSHILYILVQAPAYKC